jgi:hypothetical protein
VFLEGLFDFSFDMAGLQAVLGRARTKAIRETIHNLKREVKKKLIVIMQFLRLTPPDKRFADTTYAEIL